MYISTQTFCVAFCNNFSSAFLFVNRFLLPGFRFPSSISDISIVLLSPSNTNNVFSKTSPGKTLSLPFSTPPPIFACLKPASFFACLSLVSKAAPLIYFPCSSIPDSFSSIELKEISPPVELLPPTPGPSSILNSLLL